MANNTSQGVYSPLPQSLSDTESEEEIHSAIPRTAFIDSKHHNGIDLRQYHHVNDTDDSQLNGFPNLNASLIDETPVIKTSYRKSMSPLRKLFWVLSIVVCFLTIFIFLWILPCSENATCPAVIENKNISNWEKTYPGIELMGPINVVNGLKGKSKNLVLLIRGDVVNPQPMQAWEKIPVNGGGAISLMGNTGEVAWYLLRQKRPTDIDCSLLDANLDEQKDCIISGNEGMLEVIDSLYGNLLWGIHIHDNTSTRITTVDFPLVVFDVNDDHVNDLITVCSFNNSNHNIIVVVSGRMGNVIGNQYVTNCTNVTNLQVENNYLTYTCYKDGETKNQITLNEFFQSVFGRHILHGIIQEKHIKLDTNIENQRMIYSVNGRQLIVHNQGECPGNCNVNVQLIDQRNSQMENVLYSYSGKNVYGMVPASMSFKNSADNINSLQGHINGFILKYWQWNTDVKTENPYTNDYFNEHKVTKKQTDYNYARRYSQPVALRNYDSFYLGDRSFFPERKRRSIPSKQRRSLLSRTRNMTNTEQLLTERVSLITFNASKPHIVNASQSDIRQVCTHREKVYCQPDLSLQKRSVLIVDLDNDGSKELISYMSTFVLSNEQDDKNPKYVLESHVKVFRLESELPKFYEAVTKY